MAMQGCYCHHVKSVTQRRMMDSLSFSGSISVNKLSKNIRTTRCDPSKSNPFPKFLVVRMRQTELPLPASKNGAANGRAVKMVRTTELVNKKTMSVNKVEKTVNGSASKVNGTSQVRKRPMPVMTKTVKSRTRTSRELPPLEELKVLPSDEGFSWPMNITAPGRGLLMFGLLLFLSEFGFYWTTQNGHILEASQKQNRWWKQISILFYQIGLGHKIRRRKTSSWLRETVLQFGPTFINLGQLSSTRLDLFPREFMDELAKLQDMVPAFSPKKARKLIESKLGAPIDMLFKEFEDRPIAGASLGQVHCAIMHNGEKVVVKVQRLRLNKLFDIDLSKLSSFCFCH
ncbi:hypothetical protein V8G54_008375 [Vigna mungo]|uniref:ABC1 atypical kinase-like domain-containing protein n=1 Tax=Vigna mungo TaxID=3915 RepID=A0AAQ3P729_VIGMU